MKEIRLNRGLVALVDDEDFERVRVHSWYAVNVGKNGVPRYYVQGSKWKQGANETKYLHRFLLDAEDGIDVRFKDGNGLNNTRENLVAVPHKSEVRRLKDDRQSLIMQTLINLVDAVDNATKDSLGIFSFAAAHQIVYAGRTYEAELKAAKALLALEHKA